jgi:hypothetical protein
MQRYRRPWDGVRIRAKRSCQPAAHSDTHTHAGANTDTDTDANTNTNTNSNTNTNTNTNSNTNSNSNTNTNTNADANANANTNSNSNTNPNADADANADANADADADANTDADAGTHLDADAGTHLDADADAATGINIDVDIHVDGERAVPRCDATCLANGDRRQGGGAPTSPPLPPSRTFGCDVHDDRAFGHPAAFSSGASPSVRGQGRHSDADAASADGAVCASWDPARRLDGSIGCAETTDQTARICLEP